ncbi:hypothetical protein GA0061102_100926 [Rhizobium miluonense]|uniref:Uncharacterized protein n=1 Tax=Rhizobium miluonense TaxID=411945 RepID=A0A1C3V641_9HYPH|nr:hypothetical protein GA0061102_100926 [Rhizobium miluonense]
MPNATEVLGGLIFSKGRRWEIEWRLQGEGCHWRGQLAAALIGTVSVLPSDPVARSSGCAGHMSADGLFVRGCNVNLVNKSA